MVKKRKNTRKARLTDRDFEIFEHIARYRITTNEFLYKLFFEEDGSQPNATTKITSKLTERRYLNCWDLYGSRKYFVLGPKAVGYVDVSRKRTKALGPQALPHEFAMAAFCHRSEAPRKRVTVSELSKRQEHLLHGGVDNSHYFLEQTEEGTCLGYFVVDFASTAGNVPQKCLHQIKVRERIPELRKLVHSQRFLLGIGTGSEQKRDNIIRALKTSSWPVEFRIEVVPELIHLVASVDDSDE